MRALFSSRSPGNNALPLLGAVTVATREGSETAIAPSYEVDAANLKGRVKIRRSELCDGCHSYTEATVNGDLTKIVAKRQFTLSPGTQSIRNCLRFGKAARRRSHPSPKKLSFSRLAHSLRSNEIYDSISPKSIQILHERHVQ
jgi:hypothetical protein